MNNNYNQNASFQGNSIPNTNIPNQQSVPTSELQYIKLQGTFNENIFRANIGKIANFHMTFTDSVEWRDRIFTGIIEEAGRDHILISDPKTGKWTLIVLLYLNYVEFEEPVKYPVVTTKTY